MKRIIKRVKEPDEVKEWKELECAEWKPTWGGLTSKAKKALKLSLVEEQGYICCYCQQRILNNPKTEIEHIFLRQNCIGTNEYKAIEYTNLIASCEGNKPEQRHNKIDHKLRHCNNFRQSKDLPISPLNSNCEDYFNYGFNGKISPKNDNQNAKITIENLNLEALTKHREEYIQGMLFDEENNIVECFDKEKYLDKFSNKQDNNGIMMFCEYSSVVLNLINKLQ